MSKAYVVAYLVFPYDMVHIVALKLPLIMWKPTIPAKTEDEEVEGIVEKL